MMKRTKFRLILCSALLISLLIFIWGNSLLPSQESGELSGFVGSFLQTILPFLDLSSQRGMHCLRKAAHFSEFAALGMGFTWLYGMTISKKVWALFLPLLTGFLAASIDETIQLFSPGRYCSIVDVGIDTAGVFTGILVLTIIHFIFIRKTGEPR